MREWLALGSGSAGQLGRGSLMDARVPVRLAPRLTDCHGVPCPDRCSGRCPDGPAGRCLDDGALCAGRGQSSPAGQALGAGNPKSAIQQDGDEEDNLHDLSPGDAFGAGAAQSRDPNGFAVAAVACSGNATLVLGADGRVRVTGVLGVTRGRQDPP
jgi:hypothetical protein